MSWTNFDIFLHKHNLTSSEMSQIQSNTFEAKATNLLTEQNIGSGVNANDPVYYYNNSSEWRKALNNTTTPQGVFTVNSEVVLKGLALGINSLPSGRFYWLANSGGLVWDINSSDSKVKIGYTMSSSWFLIDIDNEGATSSVII